MGTCPICSKPLAFRDEAERKKLMPFCSPRCKLIDLGAWMSETYRVPSNAPVDELPEEEKKEE